MQGFHIIKHCKHEIRSCAIAITKSISIYFPTHSAVACNVSASLKHGILPKFCGRILGRITLEVRSWPCWIHWPIHSSHGLQQGSDFPITSSRQTHFSSPSLHFPIRVLCQQNCFQAAWVVCLCLYLIFSSVYVISPHSHMRLHMEN